MILNRLQNLQLKNYVEARIAVHEIQNNTPMPPPGPARLAYWTERSDLEADMRSKYNAFCSSLTWAADGEGDKEGDK